MPDVPALVDTAGRLLRAATSKADLSKAVAFASLTGVRQAWTGQQVAAGLTPQRLARVMRAAAEGDHLEYVILAEEMEERDWHYAAALSQRKLVVLGLERVVQAASDDKLDKDVADAVRRDIIEDEAFEDLLGGALDAIGKGWSAVEIAWRTSSNAPWLPESYEWRDPRWFRWDRETGRELRLIDEADPALGVPLPANRFVVHKPQLKMGLPVKGGLARLAAWAFLFKMYSLKDWAAFSETYGQPLRVGKYDAAASKADIDVLYQAVQMIGTDCAAVIPQAMQIEFVNALQGSSQSGASLYQAFCEFLDRQVSKAVLGQTGTTDMQKGGGFAQAKVLDGVRADLAESDAKQLARTVRRDVITPYVRFNYGAAARIPGLLLATPKAEDLQAKSAALGPFIDRGLKVPVRQVREWFDLDEPKDDEEVLVGMGGESEDVAPKVGERALARARNRAARPSPAAAGREDGDEVDALVDPLDQGWEQVMDPIVEPIARLAERCSSAEEFLAELDAAGAAFDVSPLARSLALAMFKARGLGDAADGAPRP